MTLSCNATGNPVPTISSWNKDGSATISNFRISLSADNKQLTITNVNRTDSGEYRCVASNSLGNDTSSAATVDVLCKYSIYVLVVVITLSYRWSSLLLKQKLPLKKLLSVQQLCEGILY